MVREAQETVSAKASLTTMPDVGFAEARLQALVPGSQEAKPPPPGNFRTGELIALCETLGIPPEDRQTLETILTDGVALRGGCHKISGWRALSGQEKEKANRSRIPVGANRHLFESGGKLHKNGGTGDPLLDETIRNRTFEEIERGWLSKPIPLSELPPGITKLARRFAIYQGTKADGSPKIRPIDDMRPQNQGATITHKVRIT